MVNYIWIGMTLIGLVFAAINGKMKDVNEAIFQSANEAVTLCIGLISILVFWLGIMRIAQDSGLLDKFSRLFRPIIKRLFPEVPKIILQWGIYYLTSLLICSTWQCRYTVRNKGDGAIEGVKWRKTCCKSIDDYISGIKYIRAYVNTNNCYCNPNELSFGITN